MAKRKNNDKNGDGSLKGSILSGKIDHMNLGSNINGKKEKSKNNKNHKITLKKSPHRFVMFFIVFFIITLIFFFLELNQLKNKSASSAIGSIIMLTTLMLLIGVLTVLS